MGPEAARVLIVDDDPEIIDLIPDLLQDIRAEFVSALNGQIALNILNKSDFSLIIADIKMPDLDGLQLLQELQRAGSKTPVILMTAFIDINLMYSAWRLGAFDFIDKPFDEIKFNAMVRRALEEPPPTRLNVDKRVRHEHKLQIDQSTWNKLEEYCEANNISPDEAITNIITTFLHRVA